MNAYIKNFVFVAGIMYLFAGPPVAAKEVETTDRATVVNNEMNCVSDHSKEGILDWSDVCYSSPEQKERASRDRLVAKSLDQAIQEHQALADQMLSEDADGNLQDPPKTVDDVAREQKAYYEDFKSVDDAIEAQGGHNDVISAEDNATFDSVSAIENSNVQYAENTLSSPEENIDTSWMENPSAGQNRSYDPQENDEGISNDSSQHPDLWDELALMSDRAKSISEISYKKHSFGLSYEPYYYEYEEKIVDVKLKGWWNSISGSYAYHPEGGDPLYWDWMDSYRLEGKYAWGDLDYTSGSTGSDDNEPNQMYELRSILGKDFYPFSDIVVTPYTGLGFRYLLDDSGGRQTTTGHYGYDRTSHYYYLPIGLDYTHQINPHWRVVGNGEFDIFLYGWQKSYLSDVPGVNFDVRNNQKHGFGVRTSVKFMKLTPEANLIFEPFIRYWHIEDSEVDSGGYEPDNTTIESGLKAGIEF